MKKTITKFVIIFITSAILTSCSNYGKEKNFNGVQLFYTSTVTEAEANSVGDYLIKNKFADGVKKTVQLNKSGNIYEFRMVVKKGIEQDQEYIAAFKVLAAEISNDVFNGKQVDIHLCDEYLKTQRVVLAMPTQ